MNEKERKELLKEIEEYSKKIKEEPNNDVYYNNRGVAFDNLEEFDKAIEDYN
ncbi:tetratricopeptide repeat protein, partial [Fusobacterium sp. CM21]